jgi:hypothetical protein
MLLCYALVLFSLVSLDLIDGIADMMESAAICPNAAVVPEWTDETYASCVLV